MNNYKHIFYNNNYYTVFKLKYKNLDIPVLLSFNDFKIIKKMNKNWKCNNLGFISYSYDFNGIKKDVYLHEIVMLIKNKDEGLKNLNKSILHINRVGLDNRRENLIYDIAGKESNKNCKKKSRTTELPKASGIDPNEIPTYIWYMRGDNTHGERFTVKIGDISWITTSSQDLSLRYKLEEAKMFLRNILKIRSDLYQEYCMNGDYTEEGKELLKSFYKLIHLVGFNHIEEFIPENNTFELLKPNIDLLDYDEIKILKDKRNLIKNI